MSRAAGDRRAIGLLVLGALCAVAGIALALPAARLHGLHFALGGEALQIAFTAEQVELLFAAWSGPAGASGETGLTLQWQILFPGDTLLPLGYGMGYLGLLALLRSGSGPDEAADRARWLPVAAMVFDLAENQLMAEMLTRGVDGLPIPALLPLATGALAVAKYGAIGVLTPAVGLRRVAARWRGSTHRGWLVVAGVLLLSPVGFLINSLRAAWALHG